MRFADRQAARPIQEAEQIVLLRQKRIVRRFEKKYIPEPNSGCWLWLAAVGSSGHGQFFIRKSTKRKGIINAHRASWLIYKGLIGPLDLVLHSCDNPYCVNPDHLFIGSHKDNMRDCANKGRIVVPASACGDKNPAAILSDDDVINIRSSSETVRCLAKSYGVSSSCIQEAKTGKSFPHLPGAIPIRSASEAAKEWHRHKATRGRAK